MHDIASMEMRRRLVAHLRRRGYVRDRRIMRAFLALPRETFLPEEMRRAGLPGVYRDDAIVTRRDPATHAPTSSSSQPAIMALMLEMLDVRPEHRVLEIGAGTGYNAAILAQLADPGGMVVTMDIDADAAAAAAVALREVRVRAHVVVGDGAVGMPGLARAGKGVDRLEVTASTHLVPRAWHEQMVPGGRLVVPLRLSSALDRAHAVTAFVKVEDGFDSVAVTAGGFMPLREPGAGGPSLAEPDAASSELPLRRGPWLDVAREDVSRLRLSVRYTDERPPSRWAVRRDDHWVGVDLYPT